MSISEQFPINEQEKPTIEPDFDQKTEFKTLSAEEHRDIRYAHAEATFQEYDRLNHEYHTAFQSGDSEKMVQALNELMKRDRRAEAARLYAEADRLYEIERQTQTGAIQKNQP